MIYRPRKKIAKHYSKPFKAYWETTFNESVSQVDRQCSNDMSDNISDPWKIPKNYSKSFREYSEAIFDYNTLLSSQKISDYIVQ